MAATLSRRRVSAGTVGLYAVLVVFAVLYLFPFLIQLGTSFKTDAEATNDPLNPIPSTWSLDAFRQLADSDYGLWFLNTALVAVVVTLARLFLDSLAGYALARLHFRGRQALSAGVIALIAIPPVVLLVPKFLVINQLGMYDAYTGMIIPLIADAAGIFIMKQFFETIPVEVEEAARIDGAGVFRTFWSVVLPMATPALITLTILAFQSSWNELAHMLVSRQSPELATLTVGVAQLVSGELGAGNRFPLKLAAALIMTIPVAVVFFVFQKRFVRGATEGGVKG
ncbi:MAG: carbohydrate ABC transporter permease [Pseudonocardia sediminis]